MLAHPYSGCSHTSGRCGANACCDASQVQAILVYDVTSKKSFECLDAWVREAQKFGAGHILIVVCGNKVLCPILRLQLPRPALCACGLPHRGGCRCLFSYGPEGSRSRRERKLHEHCMLYAACSDGPEEARSRRERRQGMGYSEWIYVRSPTRKACARARRVSHARKSLHASTLPELFCTYCTCRLVQHNAQLPRPAPGAQRWQVLDAKPASARRRARYDRYFETSANTGENVSQMFNTLFAGVLDMHPPQM